MLNWNETLLGKPLTKGYSFTFTNRLKTFAVAGGSRRLKEHDKYAPYIVSLQFIFNKTQFVEFQRFFNADLIQGSEYFKMRLLTSVGFTEQKCIFENGYSFSTVGVDTNVTAKVLVVRDYDLITLPDLGEFYNIIDAGVFSDPTPAIDCISANLTTSNIIDGGKSKDYL